MRHLPSPNAKIPPKNHFPANPQRRTDRITSRLYPSGSNPSLYSPLQARITSNPFALTTGYITRPDNIRHTTMISELIERLEAWLKAKLAAAARVFTPAAKAVRGKKTVLVASDGNVLDMGKRYRNTSGHSPLFSLFTFFGDR